MLTVLCMEPNHEKYSSFLVEFPPLIKLLSHLWNILGMSVIETKGLVERTTTGLGFHSPIFHSTVFFLLSS